MPAFAYYFGIRPWEIGDLTFNEIREFQRVAKQLTPQAPKRKR